MAGRIVTPDGMVPADGDKPARAPTMEERIDAAMDHWRFKRKDQAFATALNCIAYLSKGLAGMAKITEVMRNENDALAKRVEALEKKLP